MCIGILIIIILNLLNLVILDDGISFKDVIDYLFLMTIKNTLAMQKFDVILWFIYSCIAGISRIWKIYIVYVHWHSIIIILNHLNVVILDDRISLKDVIHYLFLKEHFGNSQV